MTMAQGDYLPGTYSRVGTKENPGTYLGGGSGGTSQTMPPKQTIFGMIISYGITI